MNPKDRRQHPRLEEEFSVDLLNTGDDPAISLYEAIVPAVALDVSRTGVRLKASYRVRVGTLLSMIVYNQGHQSICLCEVKWVKEDSHGVMYGLYVDKWSRLDSSLEQRLSSMESGPLAMAA